MGIWFGIFFFLRFYLFIRGEGEREGEKHQCMFAPHVAPTGNLMHNQGIWPDWE